MEKKLLSAAIVRAHQAQAGWVHGKRKSVQLLDEVELSYQDISFWQSVCFASMHTSRKWKLSTAGAAAQGIDCRFPTLNINKSKQTTLLHNLRLQMEYYPNINRYFTITKQYFRGRMRFLLVFLAFSLTSCFGNTITKCTTIIACTHSQTSSVSQ